MRGQRQGCKANGCNEDHFKHYCKFCADPDSNHLSSYCRQQQSHQNQPIFANKQFQHKSPSPKKVFQEQGQQFNNIQTDPYRNQQHQNQNIRVTTNQTKYYQPSQVFQQEHKSPSKGLHRIPVHNKVQDLLVGLINNNRLDSICVKETIEEICLVSQNTAKQIQRKDFVNLKIAIDQLQKRGDIIIAIQFAAKLSLKMTTLFQDGVPKLESKQEQTVAFTHEQCACLVSKMFFCTLKPQTNSTKFPDFTMERLFQSEMNNEQNQVKVEKIKCILNYFSCNEKQGFSQKQIIFQRSCLESQNIVKSFKIKDKIKSDYIPKDIWKNCQSKLCGLSIKSRGKIEDEQDATLVDFANKFVGGGVLNHGCVQEEILFLIYPQLLASMLITQQLERNESLFVSGARRYNEYQGYSNNFKFDGSSNDKTEKDFICIDAQDYNGTNNQVQYTEKEITWELTKAFIGFQNGQRKVLSTGRWGCGAFKGDWQLKFLVQWLAASVHNYKTMVFYNVMNQQSESQQKQLDAVICQVIDLSVGQVHEKVQYWAFMKINKKIPDHVDLFTFLTKQ